MEVEEDGSNTSTPNGPSPEKAGAEDTVREEEDEDAISAEDLQQACSFFAINQIFKIPKKVIC